ncbi:hypothetical protein DICVIV_11105 [Dictyocaulus viviparus]|uniref:Uncharacterized protein n=1 Tax=Dictyocaulus viviparus TaxID=29172 RepID=A0A0D8XKN1_DICVI|nr:hypothetical protein DICVIV_11105 [Dictyocaulus viviparus]
MNTSLVIVTLAALLCVVTANSFVKNVAIKSTSLGEPNLQMAARPLRLKRASCNNDNSSSRRKRQFFPGQAGFLFGNPALNSMFNQLMYPWYGYGYGYTNPYSYYGCCCYG